MASSSSTSPDGKTSLYLNWEPSGSIVDVRIVIRNCIRSAVRWRLTTNQPPVCNQVPPGNNCDSLFDYNAPAGSQLYTASFLMTCRRHAVVVEVNDNPASQASAIAIL